uniref:Zinc finger CCCH-type antiviral protein 1 n=1 Tax=Naja naja TaxID=35670 RepID=A0A8C6Y1H4_NAJNA
MADPAVCCYLAKVLCSQGGCMRLSELPDEMGLSLSQLQQLIEDAGPERFLLASRGGDPCVLAVSPVRLCVRQVCTGCDRLHLCKLNLRGRCRVNSCKYSHDIFSETNRKILRNHKLSGLNEEELCVLLLQNDPFLLPDVCGAYNKGGGFCTLNDSCSRLHICRYFLKGECRFPNCKRSHNLLDPLPTSLLMSEGLDQDTIWNIQTICEARIAAFMKDLRERFYTLASFSGPLSISEHLFFSFPSPRCPNAEKEKSDDICLHYVWQFCKNKNNCSMIHYDLPYRWQIFTNNGWKDLPRREEIEKAYCDPNITSFPDLQLDFMTMTSVIVPIRRLSTVSSVTKEPKFVMTTKWLWYWKNDLGQWIEYGKQDKQFQPASLTSDDLENLFLADPNGNIRFEVGSQKYLLSFKSKESHFNGLRVPSVQNIPKSGSPNTILTLSGNYFCKLAIELNRGSPEFLKIENLFQLTMKNYKIHRIERIQNPSLWQVYQWQKEQMKKKKGGQKIDERLLFHGTNPSSLKAICTDNFDWRLCGTNGTVYGKGSYFARDASYSDNYSQAKEDEKAMFLAQVLVGEFAMGHQLYTRPPAKLADVLNSYDSCVDNTTNPSIFVIFEKHQAYPAYLIFYREEKKCILS